MAIPKSVDASVGLLFSGGIDSSILLVELLRQGHAVQPFYVDSQLAWQGEELRAAHRLLQAVAQPQLRALVILSMPLADLYQNHWSITGREVPSGGLAFPSTDPCQPWFRIQGAMLAAEYATF
jgi:7-cyano-7-deazaguanine synthase